jgi:hypothetical protein
MALQASGLITLDDLHVEAGGTSGTLCSLNDEDIRDIIGVSSGGSQNIQQYYGQSSFDYTDSSGAVSGAVPDGGPYYTLVTAATTSTVLAAGTYNFVMVGRGGDGMGSAASIALWQIVLDGSEGWSFTHGSGTGSTVFTDWQIVGDSNTLIRVRHGTDASASTTAIGTKGSSARITKYASRIGGAGVANNGYSNGGGGSVDFFNLSDKSRLNGVGDTVASGYGTAPDGGHIKESGNPASSTKWLNNLADTDFGQAAGTYMQITTAGTFGLNANHGHNPFGGGSAVSANNYGASGNVYISVGVGNGGYGGGGGYSRQQSLYNPKAVSGTGGAPALWYLKV